ncbi:MAG: XRE family transcriptional regulator [Puniceicoccaceae bacterium]|nr:MAG: XRE family transcriptional regulator [Puniceicoccaceae bacterium]
MIREFGQYIRAQRCRSDSAWGERSLRRFAEHVGLEPSYLSKIERGIEAPPSEATILRIADALEEDPDVLLALAGKVSADLRAIICKRPQLFSKLLRELKSMPDHAILRLSREVTDGKW